MDSKMNEQEPAAIDLPTEQDANQPKDSHGNRYSLALRIQCLTLIAEKYPAEEISQKLGIARRTIYHIKKKARDRGFDPEKDPRILEKYVTDGPRPGRPKKRTAESAVIAPQDVLSQDVLSQDVMSQDVLPQDKFPGDVLSEDQKPQDHSE